MRPSASGTTVSDAQAADLTLTLTPVTVRPIQVWIRTAATIDAARQTLTARLTPAEAASVKVGQRARAFPIEFRSAMTQAFVSRLVPDAGRVRVEIALTAKGRESKSYVVEIVTDRGDFLSLPNEAIIEEGDRRVAYVQRGGRYEPQDIHTGLQGELYTQITGGLKDGDQVVTFGSFFIDSEFKLKGAAQGQQP